MKPFLVTIGILVVLGLIGFGLFRAIETMSDAGTDSEAMRDVADLNNSQQSSQSTTEEPVNTNPNTISMTTATIKTSKGDITLEFYPDVAPNTVANFEKLAREDFYDDVIFHRVIEGFMIQGGDPTGTGTGGPGYTFDDEFKPDSEVAKRGYVRGTLAMANSGPNTNGSQFFIVHQDTPLPYQYTIFGRVTSGMDVVDEIAASETDQNDKPLEEIVIEDVVVEGEE